MNNIPNRFYRVSIKALILNETKDRFLLCKEADDRWELPGGGLDWGETPSACLAREIREEMGLAITWLAKNPCYFLTDQSTNHPEVRIANVLYETQVEHLDFTPSEECIEIGFFNPAEIATMNTFAGPRN